MSSLKAEFNLLGHVGIAKKTLLTIYLKKYPLPVCFIEEFAIPS